MSEQAITAAWEAGKAAWPGVELEREIFAEHLATVDPAAASQFPADLYLAAACIARDPAAITLFDKEVLTKALKEIGLGESRIFDKALVDRAEQELKRQYLARGLYGVQITSTVTPIERNRVTVNFAVDEGDVTGTRTSAAPVEGVVQAHSAAVSGFFSTATSLVTWLQPS